MKLWWLFAFAWPVLLWAEPQSTNIVPSPLDSIFDAGGAVWRQAPNSFVAANRPLGFQWESASKLTARSAQPGLTFLELPVFEAKARYGTGTLQEITLSLFNRGDAGDIDETMFQRLIDVADEKLTEWTGAKGVQLRTQDRTAIVAIQRKAWIKEPYRIDLVWSYSEKSRNQGVSAPLPEYARLQITRFDPLRDPRKTILADGTTGSPKPTSALELRSRVKRLPNGDVVILSVPMVDQGQKGYCAAAVAERVLRYYGRDIDQNEIAQLAHTSANGGTNPDQMVAALRRIGDETQMDVTTLQDFELHDFERTVADYNRSAKRARKPDVEFMHQSGNTLIVESPITVYQEMDTDLLRKTRLKRDGGLQDFKMTITKYINNGVPLAWGCVVGKVPEQPEVKGFGGHMRLIIGYNDRTHEILYSDTWGAGNELKRMALNDAWTITLGLYSLQPRDLHF